MLAKGRRRVREREHNKSKKLKRPMPQRRVLFNVKNLDVFTPPPSQLPLPLPPPPSTPVSVCVPLIFNYVAYFRAAFLFFTLLFRQ